MDVLSAWVRTPLLVRNNFVTAMSSLKVVYPCNKLTEDQGILNSADEKILEALSFSPFLIVLPFSHLFLSALIAS